MQPSPAPGHEGVTQLALSMFDMAIHDALAKAAGMIERVPRLVAVQTAGCAPLARAWVQASVHGGPKQAGGHWAECMWPWEHVGHSAADGILDDETSAADRRAPLLVVSQFTLYGDVRKGRRPSWTAAGPAEPGACAEPMSCARLRPDAISAASA